MSRLRVIGIGALDRGDDAAGRLTARRLRALDPGIDVIELGGDAAALIECFDGLDGAFIVDACSSGRAAGAVMRFDAGQAPLPADMLGWSTHGLGLAEAVELARALGSLPRRCIVVAIEGQDFAPGAPLSAPVAAAVDQVAGWLAAEVQGQGGEHARGVLDARPDAEDRRHRGA